MIIKKIKKIIDKEILKNKISNKIQDNPVFFLQLNNLDKDIRKSEIFKILSIVDPKNTKLIRPKTEEEFLSYAKTKSVETNFSVPTLPTKNVPCKIDIEKIYVIKGDDFIKVGNEYTKLNGEEIILEPEIEKNQKYIIVKEILDINSFINKTRYEVIKYDS